MERSPWIIAGLLFIFVALTGPSDNTIYVRTDNVVIVLAMPGVNLGAPTAVVTSSGTVYVKEKILKP